MEELMKEKIEEAQEIICECVKKGAEQIREKENITGEDIGNLHKLTIILERIQHPERYIPEMDEIGG